MRARAWMSVLGAAVVIGIMTAGCGDMHGSSMEAPQPMTSSGMPTSGMPTSGMPSGRHTMPDGTVMGSSKMAPGHEASGGHSSMSDGQPSAAASMVCGDEIAGAVRRTFKLPALPHRTAVWSDQVYRCTYALPGGDLSLSVADLAAAGPGRAWFDKLRNRLPGASTIVGMSNFGFPAYQTDRGDVVFLKDHKTLWVNATSVATTELPAKYTRTDAAYQIASAVIACWSE